MRSNLRLDWRALALLGALLTIMIKWPGEAGGMGLVHAMPIMTTTTTTTQISTTTITTTSPILMNILNMKRNETITNSYHNKNVIDINNVNNVSLTTTITSASDTNIDVISDATTPVYNVNYNNNNNNQHVENDKNIDDDYVDIEGVADSEKNHHSSKQIITMQSSQIPVEKCNNFANENQLSSKNLNFISNRNKRKNEMKLQHKQQQGNIRNYSISNELIRNSSEIERKNLHIESSMQHIDNNVAIDKETLLVPFKFSSHNHITILSRTERSLIEDKVSVVGNNSIVRRSPHITHGSNVGGWKSRRLNISRKQQQQQKQKQKSSSSAASAAAKNNNNNLDRNERSTISHLTGPSRKIQLFIKNRYLQLLPDGTINGTQDNLSEYSK